MDPHVVGTVRPRPRYPWIEAAQVILDTVLVVLGAAAFIGLVVTVLGGSGNTR